MKKIIQFAAQYLIASEASFSDSHVRGGIKLHLCEKEHCLHTKQFTSTGDLLAFNHDFFTLEWKSDLGLKNKLVLPNYQHFEIVKWIETMALEAGIQKVFRFDKFGYHPPSNTVELLNKILDTPTTINKLTA